MKYLNIPNADFKLSRLGLGGTGINNPAEIDEGIRTIHAALDAGINYLNTADFYGSGTSEMLLREALKSRKRESVFISVKFGSLVAPDGRYYGLDVRPQTVKNYLSHTLKRLGTDYVDLYQPARINPHIPVEETVGAIAELVKAGYVRSIGLSETDAETLRKVHATHKIGLVEMQYSLLNRSIERQLIPAARELGIPVVAFGNLFNGLIGGHNIDEKLLVLANRMSAPMVENLKKVVPALNNGLKTIVDEKGITVSQLAIAWISAQGSDILALVGSRTVAQLNDTVKVADVELGDDDLKRIEHIFPIENAFNSYMLDADIDKNGLFVKR